jgi:DNA-binding MarR family transcriptional regulator
MNKEIVAQIREFNRYYTSIIGVTNNHILASEYSLTEVRVMYEIYHTPNITARLLKEIIQVDEGYLSRLIAKLVKKKLVERTKSKEDSRFFSLTLSSRGKEISRHLNQRSSDSVAEIIQHLNKREQEELVQLLDKVKALLTKNNE